MSEKTHGALSIISAPECGFYVVITPMSMHDIGMTLAAFSTLEEALKFVRERMGGKDATPAVKGMTCAEAWDRLRELGLLKADA